MDVNKSPSQFTIPGAALIFMALGFFVFSDAPFNPSRPDSLLALTSVAEDVRARLWQDPFEAVEAHKISRHPKKNKGSFYIDADTDSVSAKRASKGFENVIYQDQQHRICSFKTSGTVDVESMAHTFGELRCQVQRDNVHHDDTNVDLQILAIMVPGGPYAENRETRIRSRYAVISGLSLAGYIPQDAEHIGYVDNSKLCGKALTQASTTNNNDDVKFCDWPATIPYEWFDFEEAEDLNSNKGDDKFRYANRILVLWLDDAVIGLERPLSKLDRLRNAITPGEKDRNARIKKSTVHDEIVSVKFDVIGPAGSTSLVKMYEEVNHLSEVNDKVGGQGAPGQRTPGQEHLSECNYKSKVDSKLLNSYCNNKIRIISPRATIDKAAIDKLINKSNSDKDDSWFDLIRTIPTDEDLVKNLLCELLRRGINPYKNIRINGDDSRSLAKPLTACADVPGSILNENGLQDHIVLIGEWDTAYSRNFNHLFKKLIHEDKSVDSLDWLHSFNYFRGIDGSTGNGDVEKNPAGKKTNSDSDKENTSLRRPVGPNQFDYLRRLGEQLSVLADSIKDRGTIRAIGIVGSDTYDKLIVLQALRNRFPYVIFFTTDLDARILHADEIKWTRNIIVASGYGLNPMQEDFKYTLPFRDGYQTSLQHATYKATQCESAKDCVAKKSNEKIFTECMTAKIFEIGNHAAIDYSHDVECKISGKQGKVSHQSGQTGQKFFSYLSVSFLLIIFLVYQTSRNTRIYIIFSALFSYSLLAWVWLYDINNNVEFNAMFSGTSIWPAIIIRMVAALLALFFIFYTLVQLRKNINNIIVVDKLNFKFNKDLMDRICHRLKKLSLDENKLVKISWACLSEVFISAKNFAGFRHYVSKDIKNRHYDEPGVWSQYFISTWGWRYGQDKKININELIYQYIDLSRPGRWIKRVLFMVLLYSGLTYLFQQKFSYLPFMPYSGEDNYFALWTVSYAGLFFYYFLNFLVVDVTRLNARFVELLSRCRVEWPVSVMQAYRKNYGVNDVVASEKLKLDIIVQRSKVVDMLIFLPFLVLSLWILSRSHYFDHWHMPVQLAIIFSLGALITLSSAIRLRRSARKARQQALEKLESAYKMQLYKECAAEVSAGLRDKPKFISASRSCEHKMSERIQLIITEIEQIKTGPFLPIAQHPIVSAIALPFGGVGSLYLVDYLSNIGS